MEKEIRAITRPLRYGMGLDNMDYIFRHVAHVTEYTFTVSIQTGIQNFWELCSMLYKEQRDPAVRASVTQAAIRDGVAAANAYRASIGYDDMEPTFSNPVIKLNNQSWKLNKVGDGYVAKTNIGSRKSPHVVVINVPRGVGKRVRKHTVGELWLTPKSYTITYSETVPDIVKPHPAGKSTIHELVADVGRVNTQRKNVLAVDINAGNVTVGDDNNMVQFDLSGAINDIVDVKTREEDTTYERMQNDMKYERKGRQISHVKEETRREKQKIRHGGRKLHGKLKRRHNKLKKSDKKKDAKKVKERMRKCIVKVKRDHAKRRVDPKKSKVSRKTRIYEHHIHVVTLCIVQWALETDALLVLENLRGMYTGWSKTKGRFGRAARRKLYSAGIMKISDILYNKARFNGVEVVKMNPYHTSKLCAVCRGTLSGDYRIRDCRHCDIRVNRDVNAVENMRQTSAAARYGPQVRVNPDDARRAPDVILDSGTLVRCCGNSRADGLSVEALA